VSTTFLQPADLTSPYRRESPPSFTSLSQVFQARRNYVANELELICHRTPRPRILSVSNGQLREAETILPLCARKSGEFVAMDQNADRLSTLQQEYGSDSLRCVQSLDRCSARKFHYIYALNHLNEIQTRAARRLVKHLASLLHSGGTLFLSNFTPEARACGYLEELPWRPVCRTEKDMARMANAIPDRDSIGHVVWRDDSETLVYLEVHK
jgi:hypothetical protein